MKKNNALVERVEYLENISRNKVVLHLGAAEGNDTRELNKQNNNWLHGRLLNVAKEVIGVDINPDNESNIIACNIESHDECVEKLDKYKNVDIVIMGELIEHLFNPGTALNNLKFCKSELIITTPNVFSIRKFFWALFNREVVSKSHTCYYSVKTLTYLLNQHGYEVTKVLKYAYLGKFGYFQKWFYKLFPMLSDGIIVHAKNNLTKKIKNMDAFPPIKDLLEYLNKSGGKTDWYWCSNEDGSVSYIHYLAPEDRPKIPYKPPSLLQKIKNYFMKK